ncbi:hypothetical protein AMTRI_Chr11g100900 [Amborella trichopoda]|uniref:TauD/TfdA-like domain-containing protein n=1 Tax=Amborella trichopoda TaxID=13333 RepID=U5DEU5_AMBTC|nr:clavaminate synthase-like protein At3g21360 [Amborella trichopoda]ERN19967.1 hypothetical protein AMTR_s00071p00131570 [Amborella trichopoda]|eukprot:XP_006858500.1 clavaminate synthase-like protein At3g21360 [Amborella trichopoda]
MEFVEGKLKEEKWFGETVFPRTLLPFHRCEDGATTLSPSFPEREGGETRLAEAVRANRVWLDEQLSRHGAILFRGFDVRRAEDFQNVVEAFGWEEMDYGIGDATRSKVIDRVYSANEAPPEVLIDFHHEMSNRKEFPSKVIFFCMEPPREGGETSILPSHIIVEKMEEAMPEFVDKLGNVGAIMRLWNPKDYTTKKMFRRTWPQILQTEDKAEAEKRALMKLGCNSVKFLEDGRAEFEYGPLNPIRTFHGGRRAWFLTIVGYSGKPEDDMGLSFADGTPFPNEAFKTYKKIRDENNVNIRWEKGDILLLDNLAVQHARRPGKPPRIILASLCK